MFSFLIRKLDLKTPGREKEDKEIKPYTRADMAAAHQKEGEETDGSDLSALIAAGLGGTENIKDVDCCVTRLRCTIADPSKVNDRMLQKADQGAL